jgi:hypothetical protein
MARVFQIKNQKAARGAAAEATLQYHALPGSRKQTAFNTPWD